MPRYIRVVWRRERTYLNDDAYGTGIGSRTKWRGVGLVDPASVPLNVLDLN